MNVGFSQVRSRKRTVSNVPIPAKKAIARLFQVSLISRVLTASMRSMPSSEDTPKMQATVG